MAEKFDADLLDQRAKPNLDDDMDKPFNYMTPLSADKEA